MNNNLNNINPRLKQKTKHKAVVPIIVLIGIIAGLQVATQYAASYFQYSQRLGFSIHHIYLPWDILIWSSKWQKFYPAFFHKVFYIGAMVAALGLLIAALVKVALSNKSKANPYLHGSARWAEKEDIKNAGLLDNDQGVYVGAWIDKKGNFQYLRHNGAEHILTYAPTRSGKGVGLVVPTLLSWPHSVFITDLKGELWALTAGWRKQYAKNKVLRFEPASPNSACFNPIDCIRVGTQYEVGDVQNLATLVVDPDGKGLESHWQKTSQAFLVGLILHVLYKLKVEGFEATLPKIDLILASSEQTVKELLEEMVKYPHTPMGNHKVVGASARDMIDRPEDEAGSVLSTLKSYLSLYRDPVIAKNVSTSDFSIQDLMHHESPVSLYIITQPADIGRLRPLVRLVINMIIRLLADKIEFERIAIPLTRKELFFSRFKKRNSVPNTTVRTKQTYKHRLLGMIDEFPSLGKLEILQESLAFVAGYGIKFYLICQDINQLKSRETGYGADETITSNCHIQNAYPPNRLETASHLSTLTGETTIIKEQITISGKRFGFMLPQVSKTYQETKRPLLTADECLRIPAPKKNINGFITEPGDMLVSVAGFPIIYGKQPLYFQDPIFQLRASIPDPKTDRLIPKLTADEKIVL